jgi:hypothetical protein
MMKEFATFASWSLHAVAVCVACLFMNVMACFLTLRPGPYEEARATQRRSIQGKS